jgi:hypothetical protein
MGVQLAIKLLGHVWGNAATPKPGKATAAEPVWAETQPWCHD